MARPNSTDRGYGGRWRKARATWLLQHPTCAFPGCTRPAHHVHHKRPHKSDQALFWDQGNWEGRCAEHHNRDAQQVEVRGYSNRLGSDGLPLDKRHPFNRCEEA